MRLAAIQVRIRVWVDRFGHTGSGGGSRIELKGSGCDRCQWSWFGASFGQNTALAGTLLADTALSSLTVLSPHKLASYSYPFHPPASQIVLSALSMALQSLLHPPSYCPDHTNTPCTSPPAQVVLAREVMLSLAMLVGNTGLADLQVCGSEEGWKHECYFTGVEWGYPCSRGAIFIHIQAMHFPIRLDYYAHAESP